MCRVYSGESACLRSVSRDRFGQLLQYGMHTDSKYTPPSVTLPLNQAKKAAKIWTGGKVTDDALTLLS